MKLRALRHVVQFGLCRNRAFFPAFAGRFAAPLLVLAISCLLNTAARADQRPWSSVRFRRTSIARLQFPASEPTQPHPGCAFHDGRRIRSRAPPPGVAGLPESRAAESAPPPRYAKSHVPISRARPQTGICRPAPAAGSLRAELLRYSRADPLSWTLQILFLQAGDFGISAR